MQKCESFSREVFTNIMKPFITDKLCPKINMITIAYISQLKLLKDISKSSIKALLEIINSKIICELWRKDPFKVQKHELYLA